MLRPLNCFVGLDVASTHGPTKVLSRDAKLLTRRTRHCPDAFIVKQEVKNSQKVSRMPILGMQI